MTPIKSMGMPRTDRNKRSKFARFGLCVVLTLAAWGGTAVSAPAAGVKTREASTPKKSAVAENEMTVGNDGLELGTALVIEGRVEKPQVQFPMLREPPPQPEIHFDQSFLSEILQPDRQNVPDPD